MQMESRKKISIVSTLHYIRLVYRSVLFVLLLISYIRYRVFSEDPVLESLENTQATKMQQKIVFERINQMVEAMNDINQKDSIDNMSGKELKERLGIKEKQEVQEVQTEQQYEEQEEENININ